MSKLAELFDSDIPAGRNKLQENCANLKNIASHCDENYLKAANKTEALAGTKQYVAQSLASVASQINSLASSMLQMFDLQVEQVAGLESSINHIARGVTIYEEKVARREIGVLTTPKNCVRTHKIIAPENPEKLKKNKSVPIDYSLLDSVGHGLKFSDSSKSSTIKKRTESESSTGTPTDNAFPVYQLGPDVGRPPNSPIECDLYATVHKTSGAFSSSPRSVKKYKTKIAPVADDFTCPPPPPQPPMMDSPPMAPPPPPLPGVAVNAKTDAPRVAEYDLMPPPPPPDAMVTPLDMAERFPAPPMEVTSYPANMGLTDEEMPPPPEFVQPVDTDASAPADYMEKVIAIYGYEKQLDDELTFQEDDMIYVLQKNPNGWFEGVLNGVTGLFPGNYVQTVP